MNLNYTQICFQLNFIRSICVRSEIHQRITRLLDRSHVRESLAIPNESMNTIHAMTIVGIELLDVTLVRLENSKRLFQFPHLTFSYVFSENFSRQSSSKNSSWLRTCFAPAQLFFASLEAPTPSPHKLRSTSISRQNGYSINGSGTYARSSTIARYASPRKLQLVRAYTWTKISRIVTHLKPN